MQVAIQVASAIKEMGSPFQKIGNNAARTSQIINQSSKQADQTQHIVEESAHSILKYG